MFILSFLEQIQFRLVSDENLVASVQDPDACRVHLIGVTKVDAVEVQPEQETHGVHRAIGQAAVHLMLAPMVSQPRRHIAPDTDAIGTHHGRRMYSV